MITIEKTSRILNRFNIAFTENAVLGYLQRGQLQKASLDGSGYYSFNTKYGFSVDKDSLDEFLLEHGATEKEINEVLER
jgi:hypothetical protein